MAQTAAAIRHCENSTTQIAPKDFAQHIRDLGRWQPLNFYMPNGGTITLTKTGSPTEVTLEYSTDNCATWTTWVEDNGVRTLTLAAGGKMYVKNTSGTNTGFSTGYNDDYYTFAFSDNTYASGDLKSLLCKDSGTTYLPSYCFANLFRYANKLISAPYIRVGNVNNRSLYYCFGSCSSLKYVPKIEINTFSDTYSCQNMFGSCTSLEAIHLTTKILNAASYYYTFSDCSSLKKVVTEMTDISASNCIYRWLRNVSATGDIYCDQNLTIPTGESGIPSGWTRHDL